MRWRRVSSALVLGLGGCGPTVGTTGSGGGGADGSGGAPTNDDGASASELEGGSVDDSGSGGADCQLPPQGGRVSQEIVDATRRVAGVAIEPSSGDRVFVGRPCAERIDGGGTSRWRFELDGADCQGVVVADGIVTAAHARDGVGTLTRLHADTGALVDEITLSTGDETAVATAIDGTIYAVVTDGPYLETTATLSAVDPAGAISWTTTLPGPLSPSDMPVAAGIDGPLVGLVVREEEGDVARLQAFDSGGNPSWSWSPIDAGFEVRSIAADADGIWVVLGDPAKEYSISGGVGGPGGIARLDLQGQLVVAKTTLDDPAIEYARAVASDPCLGVYLAGHGSTLDERWGQLWVARIDADANVLWADFWDGSVVELPESPFPLDGDDLGESLAIDPSGRIVVVGSTAVREELDGDTKAVISQDWVGEYVP